MARLIKLFSLAIFAAVFGGLVVFLLGMRRKSPSVIDAVRRFNTRVSNPKQMESAGTAGAYASIIEHVGRSSGTKYQTPVGTESIPGGYLITLPYGTRPDWVKNVLAADSAIITAEGETVAVGQPEIVSTVDVAHHFDTGERRILRIFNVDQCLQVMKTSKASTTSAV